MVDEIIPPMTTVAKGRCTSAPVPVARAIGMKPNEATRAVINTGLKRVIEPFRIAISKSIPSLRNLLIKEIITSPFNTAIPERAIKPTAADIDIGMSLIHKDNNPPVRAKGIPENTRSEFFTLSNAAKRRRNINNSAKGTTICNRFVAEIKCSNWPPWPSPK